MNRKILKAKEKIYIIGSVASGKNTLAQSISHEKQLPLYEEDNILNYMSRPRADYEFKTIFNDILKLDGWIIEGQYNDSLKEAILNADLVIFFDQPLLIVKIKIIFDWLRARLIKTNRIYAPSIRILTLMLKFAVKFDKNKERLKEELVYLNKNVLIIKG